jgi:hypothetical protein
MKKSNLMTSCIPSLILTFCLLQCIIFSSTAQIYINEFMAVNATYKMDPDNKNFVDWIEIYNDSDENIYIDGWYLTDNLNNPKKWQIPKFTFIRAKGIMVFWADGTNEGRHTNFKLSDSYEQIGISNQHGELVDSIIYVSQIPDISYGRKPENIQQWSYFQEPTPAKENNTVAVDEIKYAPEVIFSLPAGFYKGAQIVVLSTTSNNAVVRHTTDGTIPNTNSEIFTDPIQINTTTVVRTISYLDGHLPSKVLTKTFFINESITLAVVSIATDKENFWNENFGIYIKGPNYDGIDWETGNFFREWERPVSLEFFENDGSPGFNLDCGVKIYGRSTRMFEQKSLAIFARNKYGTPYINYKIFDEKNITKFKNIVLRNSGNDWGNTMLRDAMAQGLVKKTTNIDCQAYRPVIVFINGKYWGIHNIREKVNKYYVESNYNIEPNKVELLTPNEDIDGFEVLDGDDKHFRKMIDFLETHDMKRKENYDSINNMMDINEFIDYNIAEIYYGNSDWPGVNSKLWREASETGKWRWMLYDTDLTFDITMGQNAKNSIRPLIDADSIGSTNPLWVTVIFRKLLENQKFKNEFIQRFASYLNTVFAPEKVGQLVDELAAGIEAELPRYIKKWGGITHEVVPYFTTLQSMDEWRINLEVLKNFAELRPEFIRLHIIEGFNVDGTINLKLKNTNPEGGKIVIQNAIISGSNFSGIYFKNIPLNIKAVPDTGYKFVGWKKQGKQETLTLVPEKDIKLTAMFKIDE